MQTSSLTVLNDAEIRHHMRNFLKIQRKVDKVTEDLMKKFSSNGGLAISEDSYTTSNGSQRLRPDALNAMTARIQFNILIYISGKMYGLSPHIVSLFNLCCKRDPDQEDGPVRKLRQLNRDLNQQVQFVTIGVKNLNLQSEIKADNSYLGSPLDSLQDLLDKELKKNAILQEQVENFTKNNYQLLSQNKLLISQVNELQDQNKQLHDALNIKQNQLLNKMEDLLSQDNHD